jgi:salicylate hydroxylase
MPDLRIAVVGAGIGGLTTALALAAEGLRCTVFERAGALPETGGGIQLSPNATRVLHRLGLGPALDAVALRPVARELRRWADGAVLGRVELGVAAERRYGAPYYALRRVDLVRVLHDALHARRGPDAVRFGLRCVDVLSPDGELRFADGSGHPAGVVIGADGLHSIVRAGIAADEVRFSGHTAYRAVIPAGLVPWMCGPPRVTVWLGPGRHCVCYPVPGGLNLVAVVPGSEPVPDLLDAFAGWHDDVRALIGAAATSGSLVHHGLFDRPALPHWYRGRVAVIGDAAHPMLPFIAQGAAQAIEDAAAIAAGLRTTGGVAGFETVRRPRVERVGAAVHAGARDHHLPDGAGQRRRDDRIAASGLPEQDWLYAS